MTEPCCVDVDRYVADQLRRGWRLAVAGLRRRRRQRRWRG